MLCRLIKIHQGKTKNGGLQLKSQNLGKWNLGTAGNAVEVPVDNPTIRVRDKM